MTDIDPMIFLVLAVIAMGIALIYLARLSRQKNQELRQEERDQRAEGAQVQTAGYNKSIVSFAFGSLSKLEAALGKILAIGVIIFVIATLLFIVVAILRNAI